MTPPIGDGQSTKTTTTTDNGANPFQTEYQQVSQLPKGYVQGDPRYGQDPNANGTGGVPQWRRTWGEVAPSAQQATGSGETPYIGPKPTTVVGGGGNGDNPFVTGTGGPFVAPSVPNDGRATPYPAPVITGGTQPPVYRTEGTGPTGPIGQETVPDWIKTITPNEQNVVGPGSVATRPGQGVRFGNTFVPFGVDGELIDIYSKARGPVEDSLYLRTKLNDLLNTGLVVGGASGVAWKAADDVFMRLPAPYQESKYGKFFGDHLSPTTRSLATTQGTFDAMQTALNSATHNEGLAATAFLTEQNAVTRMIAATRADAARGAVIADAQDAFFKAQGSNLTDAAIASRSILDPAEVAPAKAYVQAASEAAVKQTELATAEQALTQATAATKAAQDALPKSLFSDAAKRAWVEDPAHAAGKLTDRMISIAKNKFNLDPTEVQALKALQQSGANQITATATRDAAQVAATAATTARDTAASTFETLVKAAPNAADKLDFVKVPGMTAQAVEEAATFTQAEAATLARYRDALAAKTAATGAVTKATAEFTAAETALNSAKTTAQEGFGLAKLKGYGMALGEGVTIGLGTTAINIAADYAISKALGKDPKLTGQSAWGFEMAALPFIMLNPKWGIGKKIAYSATAYIASNLFGQMVGEPSGRFAELGRPSWTEVGLSTAGAMLPLPDWRARAAAATVGWGLGKVIAIAGNDGHDPKQDRDAAVESLNTAVTGRTEQSFQDAVDKARSIGKQNEGALELMRWDWFRKESGDSKDPQMIAWRGAAILAAGQGLGRMDQGSRLLDGKNHDQNKRYFPNTYVDLGGEGTQALREAAGTLWQMEQYAKAHPTEQVYGKAIGDEAQQAANLRARVEAELNKVYGAQDVKGIIEHIEYMDTKGGDQGPLAEFVVKLAAKINAVPDNDPAWKAKLCRDLAMTAVAIAEVKANSGRDGEGAVIAYAKAAEAMRLATALQRDNPNNKLILTEMARIKQAIPAAVDAQYTNSATNPWAIPGPGGQRPK